MGAMTATDLRMVMNTSSSVVPSIAQLPDPTLLLRLKPDLDFNDSTLVAVYCFIKNFIGATGNNAVAIDNKIEQAMDLVKSHLMFAVREEVEVLKEKIAELMERISHLEVENNLLRSHATQDTLSQLSSLPQVPGVTPHQPAHQPPFNPSNGPVS